MFCTRIPLFRCVPVSPISFVPNLSQDAPLDINVRIKDVVGVLDMYIKLAATPRRRCVRLRILKKGKFLYTCAFRVCAHFAQLERITRAFGATNSSSAASLAESYQNWSLKVLDLSHLWQNWPYLGSAPTPLISLSVLESLSPVC